MGNVLALRGAFIQQWRVMASGYQLLMVSIGQIPTAIAAAWIVRGSDERGVALTIAVGAAFVVVWNVCVFRTGWSLLDERWSGTLELNLLSRSPLTIVMLGKSLANVVFFGLIGLLALAAALLVAQRPIHIEHPAAFAAALLAVAVAVIALQFLFSPLAFLVGAQGGFFNAIMPLGVVLSGFFYPVSLLPPGIEWFARAIPTSWSMEALLWAVTGEESNARIALNLLAALAGVAALGAVEVWLFRRAEVRARVLGGLTEG